jgi:phosphoglycerate dehydrogenase-like enzyme
MSKAVFLAHKPHLLTAYPPDQRKEIATLWQVVGEDIQGEDWRTHADQLKEAEVIFSTWGMPTLDAEFLAAAPNLKAVFYAAGTVKGFVTEEAQQRGIVVCSSWKANAIPVAEYTLATILLSMKRFWHHMRKAPADKYTDHELECPGNYRGKVGLISLGAIGREVAILLKSFDLTVLAHDPYFPADGVAELGVQLVPMEQIFAECDVVSLHLPWLPSTEGIINRSLLSLMKPGATLINTSRGAVVNEADLCAVLAERSDLTAVLDVTHPEPPLPDSPLRFLPNVLITPHIAGSRCGEIARMGQWMVDESRLFLANQPLQHQVPLDKLESLA